jgi:hypothetical protein
MIEMMTASSVNTVYTNGGNAGSAVTASYSGSGTSLLGVGFNGGSPVSTQYLTGSIYEVVVYNSALTGTQRQQIEGYLAAKWGLSTSLPTSHPYYSIPPNHLNFTQPAGLPSFKTVATASRYTTTTAYF